MARVKVHVFLKPGVALHGLGWADVSNARVGKLIEFDLGDSVEDKAGEIKRMCETLLANTVIESYRIEVA
ncbi:MAG: phosphoribosylformylglycinamidine synthase [bacterium]|nr:MAG: phosphoribosylformylglycinamidine synthase [bacterium]